MQRFQRLRVLEQHGTIDFFQFLMTMGQELIEIAHGLLIGTHFRGAHLSKSPIYTFERIQILGQSNLGRSEYSTIVSGEGRLSPTVHLPSSNDPLFFPFTLSWLKHLVNVLDKLLNVLKKRLGSISTAQPSTYYVS